MMFFFNGSGLVGVFYLGYFRILPVDRLIDWRMDISLFLSRCTDLFIPAMFFLFCFYRASRS